MNRFKKVIPFLLIVSMILAIVGCDDGRGLEKIKKGIEGTDGRSGNGSYHIGIVTGSVSQSEDELRGAEAFLKEYGDVDSGGMVKHVTYPDNFAQEQETTIDQIVSLADDPDMKVIVVSQAVLGTYEAFKRIRQARPDMILLAGPPQDDADKMQDVANMIADVDNIKRGYLIIEAAKRMGAETFVHVSFPRHMEIDAYRRRMAIMKAACKDLGIRFTSLEAADPMETGGIKAAREDIREQMPRWVETYGKKTAFFCTNDAHTEPMIKAVTELGAIFIEPDLPSTTMGYPGAFDLDLSAETGNWNAILNKVKGAVLINGGKDRLGTWVYSFNYTTTAALAEYGRRLADGEATAGEFDDLMACFEKYTPGAEWKGSYFKDYGSKSTIMNHVLLYQDTYVFGRGPLKLTDIKVPEKYLTIPVPPIDDVND